MNRRRTAVVLAALSSLLVVGVLPGTAHAAKPSQTAVDKCVELKGSQEACDY